MKININEVEISSDSIKYSYYDLLEELYVSHEHAKKFGIDSSRHIRVTLLHKPSKVRIANFISPKQWNDEYKKRMYEELKDILVWRINQLSEGLIS